MGAIPSHIDTLVISGKQDISLLRHFLVSHQLFSKLGGRLHLFVWKAEQYLLDQIALPADVLVWYKDDIEGMVADDFRNQMYIKVIADRFVDTEWYWIADADYLLCADLHPADFFSEAGVPYWFYSTWDGGVSEQRWRRGAEDFIGHDVPYLFLNEPQFLMNTRMLASMRAKYDISLLLRADPMPADCLIYGAFVYEVHPEEYDWVDMSTERQQLALGYKINQRPPTWCELDETITLADVPPKKYVVFWSYWQLAEAKMVEFLRAAAQRMTPPVVPAIDDAPLYIRADLRELGEGNFHDVDGLYSDGWVHRVMRLWIDAGGYRTMLVRLDVAGGDRPAGSVIAVQVSNGPTTEIYPLQPGQNLLRIPLRTGQENRFSFVFGGGLAEPQGQRTLFAQLAGFSFE